MLSFPTHIRHWIVPIFVALFSVVGHFFEPGSSERFALTAMTLTNAEYYRIITGHFLHTNDWHLLLNLLGLLLLWALHGDYYRAKPQIFIWLSLCIMTGIAILIWDDTMQYVGLSGVLHGLFVWGAIQDIQRNEKTGWLLLLGIAIKILAEQLGGDVSDIANLIDANVAVNAHLFGAVSGLIIALVNASYKKTL